MKITESRLRKLIKEAVMNEILLQNHEGGATMSEENRLYHGMIEALRTYLTSEGGVPQEVIGEIHSELDEHVTAMAELIANHMGGMKTESRKRRR
jgi:hypothetical protein